jgi:DNA-binding PadR family transcriptional regulator
MKLDRVRGHLDLLLLSVLSDGPGHGYALLAALRERSGGALDFTEGAVYPALHRLEDVGLVDSDWEQVLGRRRRMYRITSSGARALATQRSDWRALVDAVEAVLRPAPLNAAVAR